jgi:hypothetical protein
MARAASPDRIHGIDGADDAIATHQKRVLHKAARLNILCLIAIPLCRRCGAMTRQTGSDADVDRVVNRDSFDSASHSGDRSFRFLPGEIG